MGGYVTYQQDTENDQELSSRGAGRAHAHRVCRLPNCHPRSKVATCYSLAKKASEQDPIIRVPVPVPVPSAILF